MRNLSAAQWGLVSALLDEALDLAPIDRERWAGSLDQREPVLASSVRKLLAAHAACESASFLPAVERAAEQSTEAWVAGERVGLYELKRELGRGGMATVWLAARTDPSAPAREVALKLPHPGWFPGLSERLGRERDILASLEHAHIARLYDAGLDQRGRPYLALEYVDGQAIDVFCRERNLGIDARIELILQVADALAHAHSRLVVHRDLKPSNILVTATGQVRLLDFGIAKLMQGELAHETQLTSVAGRLLTLDYASPEQIRGEPIGTASDVYSLGVVAFELLAGARPYRLQRASGAQLEQAIAKLDPPLASVAASDSHSVRELRGDVDAILNKALKKLPSERYASVDAFAADLRRHLRGDAIDARPDSTWYRLSRLVRRNKLATATVVAVMVAIPAGAAAQAAVLVTIAVGAGAALWQARQARRNAWLAQGEARRAEDVKEFIASIFRSGDPFYGGHQHMSAIEMLMLARARIEKELQGQPEIEVELLAIVGESLMNLQQLDAAEATFLRAIERGRAALPADNVFVAQAQAFRAGVALQQGKWDAAMEQAETAIPVLRACGRRAARPLVNSLQHRSFLCHQTGRAEEAEKYGIEAVEVALRHLGPDHSETILAQRNLAQTYLFTGKPALAREHAEPAFRAAQRRLGGAAADGLHCETQDVFGRALMETGELDAGIEQLSAAEQSSRALFGEDSNSHAGICSWLSRAHLKRGDLAAAIDWRRRCIDILTRTEAGGEGRSIALVGIGLARLYVAARRPREARERLQVDAAWVERAGDKESALVLEHGFLRCAAQIQVGELEEAERGLQLNVAARRQANDPRLAESLSALGELARLQGRVTDSVAFHEQAWAALEGSKADESLRARVDLGIGLLQLQTMDAAALDSLTRAEHLYRAAFKVMTPEHAETLVALGQTHLARGDTTSALRALEEATAFWSTFDPAHPHAQEAERWLQRARVASHPAVGSG